jgi:hypothetical protein
MSTPDRDTRSLARPVDALAAVRQHPEWHFRSGTFDAREALALLTDEAVQHGSVDLFVQQIDDWWVLASSHDWLEGDLSAYFSPVPDPARGPNTSRVEVLLTAFCRSVWTATSGQSFDISRTVLPPERVRAVLETASWARVVAFRPPAASAREGSEIERPLRHLQLVPGDLSPQYDDAFKRLPHKLEQARDSWTES